MAKYVKDSKYVKTSGKVGGGTNFSMKLSNKTNVSSNALKGRKK